MFGKIGTRLKTEAFKEAFFVPDLAKEQAQEGYVLRQACRQAREKYEFNVEIKIIS